uniref:RING-type E3 ubiquitin transferase n=1 Tax=Hanusia phi TaxID=3032 RepID=A0A7S0EH18_9CRYP|mmetsp:Transcript_23302/g.52330  ORF Transcript_23302/g.52330 Transcript_23302/m.52330 type:complete len:718 (+) Transcript_23302:85-2238(+)
MDEQQREEVRKRWAAQAEPSSSGPQPETSEITSDDAENKSSTEQELQFKEYQARMRERFQQQGHSEPGSVAHYSHAANTTTTTDQTLNASTAMESSQVPASAPEPESTASGSSATTESQRNPPATVVSGVDRQSQQPTTRPTGMNRPMVPDTVRQALTPSQLELLYEAMGEQQGGFHGFPGPSNFDSMPPPRFPNAESHMPRDFPPAFMGGQGPPRNRNPFGNVDDDGEGMPSNWDPRNARRSDDEDRIHRQQVEELRRRQRQQNQPSTQGDAAETQETISGPAMVQDEITGQMRPSNAQGPVQRLTDDFSPGPGFQPFPMRSDMPMTLREEALREQSFEYGGGGLGRMPPHVQSMLGGALGSEEPSYEELSALQERIGNVSRGVTETTIEQNSFTFEYAPPSPTSEAGANLQRDPTLARCPVCLCELEKGDACRRLPCLHMFHKDCVDDWLKRDRHCPVCKTDIVTGAQETRREAGDQQCSAAAMPGEPDYSPPGWGSDDEFEGIGIPGFGPRPGRSQPGVGFSNPAAASSAMSAGRPAFPPWMNQPRSDVLAAAAESRFNAPSESAGMVRDDVTGQMRPAAAQGPVERLAGPVEGDLWAGMSNRAGGWEAMYGGASSYFDMLHSTGPLGSLRRRGGGAPPGLDPATELLSRTSLYPDSGHPSYPPQGGPVSAEALLQQARSQHAMAQQAMRDGSFPAATQPSGAPREWSHLYQGR